MESTQEPNYVKKMAEVIEKQPLNSTKFKPGNRRGFQPGKSGNPKGRPKGVRYITEALRFVAAETDSTGATNADKLAAVIWSKALKGDIRFIELILSRSEGPPMPHALPLGPSLERVRGEMRIHQRMRERQIDYPEAVNEIFDEAVDLGLIALPEGNRDTAMNQQPKQMEKITNATLRLNTTDSARLEHDQRR